MSEDKQRLNIKRFYSVFLEIILFFFFLFTGISELYSGLKIWAIFSFIVSIGTLLIIVLNSIKIFGKLGK